MFPTSVGMNRRFCHVDLKEENVPHECGDEPDPGYWGGNGNHVPHAGGDKPNDLPDSGVPTKCSHTCRDKPAPELVALPLAVRFPTDVGQAIAYITKKPLNAAALVWRENEKSQGYRIARTAARQSHGYGAEFRLLAILS